MTRPRILIAMHYLEIGGAEAALIGLLNAFDYTRMDVDLFLYSHRGEFMEFIPPQAKLLPEIKEYAMIEAPMVRALRGMCLGVVYGRLKSKIKFSRYVRHSNPKDGNAIFSYVGKCVTPYLPDINDACYDLAISFMTPHNIVLDKIKAKKKICWIHTDYTQIDINAGLELPVWAAYHNIISISPTVTDSFCTVFPSLRNKIIEIGNILPEKIIKRRAEEFIPAEIDINNFNLLTIGRFSYPKNLDNVPEICREVIGKTGIKNLKWHIIGFGGDEQLIRQRIRDAGMDNNVIILGKRTNPYPYIKSCDLYIQPSRYEGKSVTVREAQMLGKPVVITNYPTAKSQIETGIDGMIVPLDNTGCAEELSKIILDKPLLSKLSYNTAQRDYSGKNEVEKIYSLL